MTTTEARTAAMLANRLSGTPDCWKSSGKYLIIVPSALRSNTCFPPSDEIAVNKVASGVKAVKFKPEIKAKDIDFQ